MFTRRDISVLIAAAVITTTCIVVTACGLDIKSQAIGVDGDAGTTSSGTDPSTQQQQQQQQQQDNPDGSLTRTDDDDGGGSVVVDAGNIFTAPDAAVDAGVLCNKTALLLTDTDSDSLNGAASAFTQAGFTVTKVADYTKYNGTPSPSGMGVVVILNGAIGSSDMAPAGQQAIVTALGGGTGLVAEEWSGWLVSQGKFKTLAPYILFQASSKGAYYGDSLVTLTLTLTGGPHPIWTNLPTKLTTAKTTVVVVGSARPGPITVIAPATVGSQTLAGPGVLVSAQGITRVVGTSLAVNYNTVREDALNNDANVRALFTNMALWAAHCL